MESQPPRIRKSFVIRGQCYSNTTMSMLGWQQKHDESPSKIFRHVLNYWFSTEAPRTCLQLVNALLFRGCRNNGIYGGVKSPAYTPQAVCISPITIIFILCRCGFVESKRCLANPSSEYSLRESIGYWRHDWRTSWRLCWHMSSIVAAYCAAPAIAILKSETRPPLGVSPTRKGRPSNSSTNVQLHP
jgi:hypothetical protein